MRKTKQCVFGIGLLLLMGALNTASAEEGALDGGQLFAAKACIGCHGVDGRTPIMPLYPKVAGQNEGYLYNQMHDIKNGGRSNGQSMVMKGIMASVSEDEMRAIAAWLSTQ